MNRAELEHLQRVLDRRHDARLRAQQGTLKLASMTKAMNVVRLMDGLAVAQPSEMEKRAMAAGLHISPHGVWEVPVFKRFPHLKTMLGNDGQIADLVALMVDMSPFSQITKDLSAKQVKEMLNTYYDLCVEIIESHGGVIEKFAGDAVVALFGHPFRQEGHLDQRTSAQDTRAADQAARDMITKTQEVFEVESARSKAAIVRGQVYLGWVGPESYRDLTVIGTPLTLLSRLEDLIAGDEIILPEKDFQAMIHAGLLSIDTSPLARWRYPWMCSDPEEQTLRGVGMVQYRRIKKKEN